MRASSYVRSLSLNKLLVDDVIELYEKKNALYIHVYIYQNTREFKKNIKIYKNETLMRMIQHANARTRHTIVCAYRIIYIYIEILKSSV